MILDNYATHKHANVKAWLAKHPRFHLHFTPTSSSWLNLVERSFRELTDKALHMIERGYSTPEARDLSHSGLEQCLDKMAALVEGVAR